ncbi:hypothetical protein ABGV49_06430 [Chromobacterium vaccinii]|uniref:Gfo/Idh/MocA-like oxidoreductase C-terminal domain-containing protein n=1 Tax=Chromobacterium vaccinii TaxID=1108595 RepID=A0ABV0F9C1_9NEIS
MIVIPPIADRKIRFALVGCGRIANNHFGALEKHAPETDGREGLKSLELLIAMYLSARDGRRVSLPLDY